MTAILIRYSLLLVVAIALVVASVMWALSAIFDAIRTPIENAIISILGGFNGAGGGTQ